MISHGNENKTNGEYGSRSHSRYRSDRFDTIRDGRMMHTLDRRGDRHRYYSSSGSDRHHDRHHCHPYMRNDRGYLPDEFKKAKPPTFDGEMKKSQDVEAWLLGMRKLFILHDYSENMKARISIFSLKGKVDIWWEDVKNIKDIHEDDFTWHAFENLFKKKYLSKRYYDEKAKEFYELLMGSMIDEEYTSRFLEML